MISLTERQRKQVKGIIESTPSQVEERLDRLRRGDVVDHRIASSYRGVAFKCQKLAICQVYNGETEASRRWFDRAAQNFGQAATAALEMQPFATSYRRVPMTLLERVYAATCARKFGSAKDAALQIIDLDPKEGIEAVEGDIVFKPDKYYLARTLGGAMLDRLDHDDFKSLEAINNKKPEPHWQYGEAVLAFARGLDTGDQSQLESGIHTAIGYHERERHPENVIDQIMAVEATAMVSIASEQGYLIDLDHEQVPNSLVNPDR